MTKLLLLVIICLATFGKAQQTDTVVVYQEVVVRDTVYVSKPIVNKKKPTTILPKKYSKMDWTPITNFDYGGGLIAGMKNLNLFDRFSDRSNLGFGGEVWMKKQVIMPRVGIGLGGRYMFWTKTVSIEDGIDGPLSGIFFTGNGSPAIFEKITDKHSAISVPFTVEYSVGSITPFVGVSANYSSYKMWFTFPENGILQKSQQLKSSTFSPGFLSGLRYKTGRLIFSLEYQQQQFNKIIYKTSEVGGFKMQLDHDFRDRQFLIGLRYSFKN